MLFAVQSGNKLAVWQYKKGIFPYQSKINERNGLLILKAQYKELTSHSLFLYLY